MVEEINVKCSVAALKPLHNTWISHRNRSSGHAWHRREQIMIGRWRRMKRSKRRRRRKKRKKGREEEEHSYKLCNIEHFNEESLLRVTDKF